MLILKKIILSVLVVSVIVGVAALVHSGGAGVGAVVVPLSERVGG